MEFCNYFFNYLSKFCVRYNSLKLQKHVAFLAVLNIGKQSLQYRLSVCSCEVKQECLLNLHLIAGTKFFVKAARL